jgi:hypothetical protein
MNKRQRKKEYKKYTKELREDIINTLKLSVLDDSPWHRLMSPISVEKLEETRKACNAYIDYYMRPMRYPTFNLTKDDDRIILRINTGK